MKALVKSYSLTITNKSNTTGGLCAISALEYIFRKYGYHIEQGYGHFISGGAMGMDTWAAEAVLKLKEKHSWILLEMVSPYDDQAKSWTAEYRQRHDHLFEKADIVTATSNSFYRGCYHKRNRYMVDNADIVMACFDGKAGGTKVTVDYAKKNEVPVVMLPPTAVH